MILAEHATPQSLVYSPAWEIEDFPSCCSCDCVLRLEAEYTSLTQRKNERLLLIQEKFEVNSIVSDSYSLQQLNHSMGEAAFAVSRDIAFAAVLADMMRTPQHLFIGTDNMSDHGDVHRGPFSTRKFFPWLSRNGLGTVKKGVTRLGNVDLACWSAILHIDLARRYVSTRKSEYVQQYNRFANKCVADTGRSGGPVQW